MKVSRQAQDLKVALVHDDLVQWGGAERMLAALSEVFPKAPIFTSVIDWKNPFVKKHFTGKQIVTSFLQQIPGGKSLYKTLFPLHPLAFEMFDFSAFNIVISQTTRFAKAIITKPQTAHLCYCHTPPQFWRHFSKEKEPWVLKPYFKFLKKYDQITSKRVDLWVAGSKNARERISQAYHVDSQVIYPFIDIPSDFSLEPFEGGYLLVISRLNRYKRVDLVIKAANRLKTPLKIVGIGPEFSYLQSIAGPTVELVGPVDEELKWKLLSGCQVLVIAGEEDFGLTSLEAQAVGKPVVAFKKGGVLETVIEGETGYFFENQTVEDLIAALAGLYKRGYNQKRCLLQASAFSKNRFIQNFQKLVNSI